MPMKTSPKPTVEMRSSVDRFDFPATSLVVVLPPATVVVEPPGAVVVELPGADVVEPAPVVVVVEPPVVVVVAAVPTEVLGPTTETSFVVPGPAARGRVVVAAGAGPEQQRDADQRRGAPTRHVAATWMWCVSPSRRRYAAAPPGCPRAAHRQCPPCRVPPCPSAPTPSSPRRERARSALTFEALARDGRARRGRLTTARGTVETPVFMPVGTRATVKGLTPPTLEALGARDRPRQHLPPHAAARRRAGRASWAGCTGFMGWDGPILTDSGGYQVFSLARREDQRPRRDVPLAHRRLAARAHPRAGRRDPGSTSASDIAMVLDECPPGAPAPEDECAVRRWSAPSAGRERLPRRRADRAGPGAVRDRPGRRRPRAAGRAPGARRAGLRRLRARRASVGETQAEMLPALDAAVAELPGRPAPLPDGRRRPGRPRRRGRAPASTCSTACCRPASPATAPCSRRRGGSTSATPATPVTTRRSIRPSRSRPGTPRGYLRHLLKVNEPTAGRILTLHNLAYLFDLVGRVRAAVEAGTLDALRTEVRTSWAEPAP